MKRLLLLFSLLVAIFSSKAQNSVNVTLLVTPPYSPYLSDYTEFGQQNVLQLQNTTAASLQVKLVGSITGLDNGLFLNTEPDYQPALPIILAPFQTYSVNSASPSKDFLDANNTETNVSQQQQNAILASGVLPEGTYQLCVRAVDYNTNEPLSPEGTGCATFTIAYPVPPIPINPICGNTVENPFPSFSWTPVYSQGSFFLYDLYLLRLVESQIPDDAMWLAIAGNVGNPIVIRNLVSGIYQYKPSDIPLQQGATYAWCVVARDAAQNIIVANQGRSEVCTFVYQTPTPPTTPVVVQEETTPVLPVDFNLNNTTVSGTLLYRYYDNEQFGDPGIPNYNPSKTVGGTTLNAAEIAALPNQTAAQNQSPTPMNTSPGATQTGGSGNLLSSGFAFSNLGAFNQNLMGTQQGKISIDPAVKYLFNNTLSNNGSEPLRQTSVSLYLEYVAVKKTFGVETSFFEVIPGAEMYYNRVSVSNHGAAIDPQMVTAIQNNGGNAQNAMDYRPLGSELIATTQTDLSGNFSFDFDLTENTGLLSKDVTLMRVKYNKPPDEAEEQQWVNPLDMVSNPMQEIATPGEGALNPGAGLIMPGANQSIFGNTQLQGNKGWGGSSAGFNALNNVLQNPGSNLPGMNQQLQQGPAQPNLMLPEGDPLVEYLSYKAYHLFKVLRIKVNNPQFVSPDILIFVQPGEVLNLPPVSTFVNSFDAEIQAKAGGKESEADQLYLTPGSALSNFSVRIGRPKSFWDARPTSYPLHEGMDLLPEEFFNISHAAPYYINAGNQQKPASLKLTSTGTTAANGKITFKRLVCNKPGTAGDLHYFEIQMPLTGIYNYAGSWGCIGVDARLPQHMRDAQHSYNFRPTKLIADVKLEPLAPEILLRTITKSNIETQPLPGVEVFMLNYNQSGSTFNYTGYTQNSTDANGYLRLSNLPIVTGLQGVTNPYRRLMLNKNGYPTQYLPANIPNAGNNAFNYIEPLKKGQRRDLGEIIMEGKAEVFGYVRDEENNPVMALVKIGDGPFMMTDMSTSMSGYGSPLHRTVPEETLPSGSGWPAASFNLMDQGAFQGISSIPTTPLQSLPGSGLVPMQGSTNPGNFSMAGTSWNNPLLVNVEPQVSRFAINAPSGPQTRVVVIPMSDAYIPDTFYVNIPTGNTPVNIGTFMVFEKAHRVKVLVRRKAPIPGQLNQPAANALVEIGDYGMQTNSGGAALFKFTTPDSYFRVYVKDGNRVPIEEYRYLPISKYYTVLEYVTEAGMTVSGRVLDGETNQPLAQARVFYEHGVTAYGATVLETFTDAQGNYSLSGLPRSNIVLRAAKADNTITYIGSSRAIATPQASITGFDFSLSRFNGDFSSMYGFPVEISRVRDMKNGQLQVSGALVNIPGNGNFRMYDPQQRVRFTGVAIVAGAQTNAQGKPIYRPVQAEVPTQETALRTRLHNSFMADFKGLSGGFITVKEKSSGLGGLFGKVQTDLESFRFAFDYSGAFYLGEAQSTPGFHPFVSNPASYPEREFFIMNLTHWNMPIPILFTVHEFDARADAALSRLKKDTVKIVTRLYPNLPLAGDVVVEAGTIRVSPNTIQIGNPGEQLSFNLEKWKVKSLQGWSFSIPHGGIIVPKALLQTKVADIPINNLILRPDNLIMPQDNIDLNNLSVGGGLTKLKQYPGNQAIFSFDPACTFDMGPHWRFSLFPSNPDNPACYIQGLPGFAANDKIDMGAFTIYSNDASLMQPVFQTKTFSNVAQYNIANITNLTDGIELAGPLSLGIPGMTTPNMILVFTKPGSNIVREVRALDIALETPGKVFFNGDNGTQNYTFSNGFFEAKGKLIFEDDNPNDDKKIELKGLLTKNNGLITLTIPKLIANSTADNAYQYIPLNGGDTKLKVLNGEQRVIGGNWNTLAYDADLITNQGLSDDKTLTYLVSGAVEVSQADENALKIDKIDTPLGGMSIVFDWQTGMFLGSVNIDFPITISTVTLNSGMMEICFSGKGFYFDMIGNVSLPGLDAFANVNFGFLTGYYPELPPSVLARHKDIMFLLDVPVYLKNDGIAGLYFNANIAPPIANWSTSVTIPVLPPITVGAGVSAGADMNFIINFGKQDMVMAIDAAAYAKAWAGVDILVCDFCVGALARFTANGTIKISEPASISGGACASLTMFGSFCGGSLDVTAGVDAQFSTANGVDISLQWSPCGAPATKQDMSCEF